MTDYGTDFDGIDDIDANWSFQTNQTKVLQNDIARFLQMPRGALWYAPDRGYDVRALVADTGPNPSDVEQAIEAECLKDERVQSAVCQITDNGAGSWTIAVQIVPVTGVAFTLTLLVTQVTVTVLEAGT